MKTKRTIVFIHGRLDGIQHEDSARKDEEEGEVSIFRRNIRRI